VPAKSTELGLKEKRHLEAAEGWLGLGSVIEAETELGLIATKLQSHPDVLRVRYHVLAAKKDWEAAVATAKMLTLLLPDTSFGFVHQAYALHELKRTQEAMNVLLPVAHRFKEEPILFYNLACYSCQLGDNVGARMWLDKAYEAGDEAKLREMASEDPDLVPLFKKPKK
jgi:predicted Zn-dependent protease